MLTAYERRLILSYFSNAASRLPRHCPEARALADCVAEHGDLLSLAFQPTLECGVPEGELSVGQWQHLRDTLARQRAAAKRVRVDRTALRIRRLGRETRLSRTDIAILEFLLRYHTQPLIESLIDAVFNVGLGRGTHEEVFKVGRRALPDLLGVSVGACFARLAAHAPLARSGLVFIRRTAERLRDAVEAAFGPLEMVDVGDKRRHWRLQSAVLRHLLRVSREELAEIGSAARWLDRAGLPDRAGALRELAGKLRALRRPLSITEFNSDLELVMRTEGLAMRPGPRPRLEQGLVSLLRAGHPGESEGGVRLSRPIHGATQPAARPALRSALREPGVPGGARGRGGRHAPLAARQRE